MATALWRGIRFTLGPREVWNGQIGPLVLDLKRSRVNGLWHAHVAAWWPREVTPGFDCRREVWGNGEALDPGGALDIALDVFRRALGETMLACEHSNRALNELGSGEWRREADSCDGMRETVGKSRSSRKARWSGSRSLTEAEGPQLLLYAKHLRD